jgi:hypothetical protein
MYLLLNAKLRKDDEMPLVVDQLSLWTIGFKWENLDPKRMWFRIPSPVRDNFSTLVEAILHDQLDCLTLAPEKYAGDDSEIAAHHVRYWLSEIYAVVEGRDFQRKLLRHAIIERRAFRDWCERRSIPLPEFWFPPGWTDYRWPQEDFGPMPQPSESSEPRLGSEPTVIADSAAPLVVEGDPSRKLKQVQLAKIVCGQIATVIWKDEPTKTIAAMSKDGSCPMTWCKSTARTG